mmetsp:Transcript_110306/g.351606  ORF Transcript_110306/g.351606 Transcript_110306/m.351606 type:complete len:87 (-) Transcript_110306:184-444(-)
MATPQPRCERESLQSAATQVLQVAAELYTTLEGGSWEAVLRLAGRSSEGPAACASAARPLTLLWALAHALPSAGTEAPGRAQRGAR